jgi:hypothetical protein
MGNLLLADLDGLPSGGQLPTEGALESYQFRGLRAHDHSRPSGLTSFLGLSLATSMFADVL